MAPWRRQLVDLGHGNIMTSGQQAQVYGGGIGYACNVAFISGSFYGYIQGNGGSITPATYKGVTLLHVGVHGGADDFSIYMIPPVLPQNFFDRVIVQDTAGVFRTYLTSAAFYSPGSTTWQWGVGANPVWTATGLRSVRLLP